AGETAAGQHGGRWAADPEAAKAAREPDRRAEKERGGCRGGWGPVGAASRAAPARPRSARGAHLAFGTWGRQGFRSLSGSGKLWLTTARVLGITPPRSPRGTGR